MYTIINLTPHAVNVLTESGEVRTFEPSGKLARVAVTRTDAGTIPAYGIRLSCPKVGAVEGLPEESPTDCPFCGQIGGVSVYDTICQDHGEPFRFAPLYIVSAMVREACPDRHDLLSPGELIRDGKGNITGCRGFDVNR
jgi:hypothetical protein